MSAKESILKASQTLFDQAWEKESLRIKGIWEGYQNFVNSYQDKHNKIDYYFLTVLNKFFTDSDWQQRSVYNYITSAKYSKLEAFRRFIHEIAHRYNGIENYLTQHKEQYHEMITAKMLQAINKHLTDDYVSVTEPLVFNSEKGYVVRCKVAKEDEEKMFETYCIPAGGWNIQEFHYRYRSSLK